MTLLAAPSLPSLGSGLPRPALCFQLGEALFYVFVLLLVDFFPLAGLDRLCLLPLLGPFALLLLGRLLSDSRHGDKDTKHYLSAHQKNYQPCKKRGKGGIR